MGKPLLTLCLSGPGLLNIRKEGTFIIDTGDIEEADHKDFYKHESLGSKFNLLAMANKRKITKEDEINNQLAKLNIRPEQVTKVILTHLWNHTDGLKFFRQTKF